jgi:class 3 adenylate cyclase/predicted ATPase
MTFEEILDQAIAMLQRRGRLTYGALQRQFHLDDATLDDLKEQLLYASPQVVDDAGRGLVWNDETAVAPTTVPPASLSAPPGPPRAPQAGQLPQTATPPATPPLREAERRQLTVLFCDLVGSTALSAQLDPEDLREVVRAYQTTCAEVIQRFEGYIAQYLGDGLLVYFGYPQAHDDDAQRAVQASLGMLTAMQALYTRVEQDKGIRLAVRLGIHTGLVVVGDMGGAGRHEQLAVGETPNIAARLQGLAAPDTVVMSEATAQLVQGYFVCQALDAQALKGLTQPLMVYRVLHESGAQTRLDVAATRGLTRLVGREQEIGLLADRWQRATAGRGQVVVLTGEAGIGKSRLVQVLRNQVVGPAATCIECRCSPHTQQSALYPVIAHLERALAFARHDTPADKLHKVEGALASYAVPLADLVPLFAALLSLPPPAHAPPLTLTPQRQRQKTLEALLAWLWQETDQHPVLCIVEDLHWVDPSTLEFLHLLVDESSTARILVLLTCRPEFTPPWPSLAHLTPLTLTRLLRLQVEHMVASVAGAKALPQDVMQQIVAKTDGIPLFVEELTKTVLESGLLREQADHYELTGSLPALAIPATLQDSLMARLDRLSAVKTVAQLGATLGRQFAYDLLQAVSPLDEDTLQQGLRQLVGAELLYQQGMPPQATYLFKHALIQDAAYQSLLRSTRQHYHQRIVQVLEAQCAETVETQPELLAHHCTEAGLLAQALPYWQQAGQRALERSAHVEAISHLTTGLDLLTSLPDTPERAHQELVLQTTLGAAFMATKGYAAAEVEHAYARARQLCRHVGDTPHLFPVLEGLYAFYLVRAECQIAQELAEQSLRQAQHFHDPARLVEAHFTLGNILLWRGAFAAARAHLEQGITLYDHQEHRALVFMSTNPGVFCWGFLAHVLWYLGYPAQAVKASSAALTLAEELSHPFSVGFALAFAAWLHAYRREARRTLEAADANITLATTQGFAFVRAHATVLRGWALAEQGHGEEGLTQIRQGIAAYQATGAELERPHWLALLAEAHGKVGQAEAGLSVLAKVLAAVEKNGVCFCEAELYRLKGELLLVHSTAHHAEAEICFHHAIRLAQSQHAKSWELRAATSLARRWQQQGKWAEARDLLGPIYGWFTEGSDTADLQDARALLEALA